MTYRYSIPHVSTRRHQELKYLPNSPGAMSAELGMVGVETPRDIALAKCPSSS